MKLDRPLIRKTLLDNLGKEDNPYQVYIGADETSAVQLKNLDNSNVYVRQVSVTNKMLAFDATLKLDSELYRVTIVDDNAPNANTGYWISLDEGITKTKVSFCYRQSRSKASFWWVFLKND